MSDLLGRGDAPKESDTVIKVDDDGSVWKYVLSGLPNLWVKGGIQYGADGYTFYFENIQAIHEKICDYVLSRSAFSSAEFRFLRKEIGLTIDEFSLLAGADSEAVAQWEMEKGFAVETAEVRIREHYAMWKAGVLSTKSNTRDNRRQATL